MNVASAQVELEEEKGGVGVWVWGVLALVVCLVAISGQSFWIDETLTGLEAGKPTLGGLWQRIIYEKGSDLQMPLYMVYIWSWARAFGTGEWALRAANIPWFVGGVMVFVAAMPSSRKVAMGLVVLGCPFAWYYLGEARSYAMQLSASLICFGALYRLSRGGELSAKAEAGWVVAFWFAVVALSGSSLLGMIWAGAACLCLPVVFGWRRLGQLARGHWLACALAGVALVATGLYYVWTLKVGARASTVGRTDVRNMMFIGYELLGFGGFGPGRVEIRQGGLGAFRPFALGLAVFGVMVVGVLLAGVWQLWRGTSRRMAVGVFVVLAVPTVVLLGAGYAMQFRVLGRHFTPVLPVVLFVMCVGLGGLGWAKRAIGVGFVVLSVVSCLELRFDSRHEKDDYRGAAAVAVAALGQGNTVWWNAGLQGAVYYQVPVSTGQEGKAEAVYMVNPEMGDLGALTGPDVIIASKPDMYDEHGALAEYILRGPYNKGAVLPAFTVWERKGGVHGR
jgi:hypothetical protein